MLGDPRGANEAGFDRAAGKADLKWRFKAADLPPEGVALSADVNDSKVFSVEHDQPRAGTEDRLAAGMKAAQWLRQCFALDSERHRRRLAARDHQPIELLEVGRHADFAHSCAEPAQHLAMRFKVALEG